MTGVVSGTIECANWKEQTLETIEGVSKLTRASAQNAYGGAMEAESTVEYLMFYSDPSTAQFTGFEHVRGRLGGKSGGFVLLHVGTFRDGRSETTLTVLTGSGTGELVGLNGAGTATWNGQHWHASCYSLEYDFTSAD